MSVANSRYSIFWAPALIKIHSYQHALKNGYCSGKLQLQAGQDCSGNPTTLPCTLGIKWQTLAWARKPACLANAPVGKLLSKAVWPFKLHLQHWIASYWMPIPSRRQYIRLTGNIQFWQHGRRRVKRRTKISFQKKKPRSEKRIDNTTTRVVGECPGSAV